MASTSTQQLFETALQHHQAGRLSQAEPLYRQILAQQPNHADSLHLLGLIACQMGRHEIGINLIERAIALRPDWPEASFNLGRALQDMKRTDQAIAAYRRAIALKGDYPAALNNLGDALRSSGQPDEAIAACRKAIALKPDFPEAHNNLGNALGDTGRVDEAVVAYRQAIALRPAYPEAHSNLGSALRDSGRLDEAVAEFRRAIALKPDFHAAHSNLGNALLDKGELDAAIAAYRHTIALRGDFPEAHNNLGVALKDSGQLDEAIAACRQAITLKPDYHEAWSNLGIALCNTGKPQEAVAAFNHAIALKPLYPEAHYNLALALLLQGDFPQGWKEYEWRWRVKDFPAARPNLAQPQWDGSDLAGRTILIHAEQGFGDVVQFIRYVPLVAGRCGKVIVVSPPELSRLLRPMPGVPQWILPGEALPPFDVHCPLLSLPLALGTTVQSIPRSVPYLNADAPAIEQWRERLAGDRTRLKVGLAWAGNKTHKNDRFRSLPLSILAPLAQAGDVAIYSLQKGDSARQAPPAGMKLIDWTDELHDFADTAALIANLDLVISVDTAVAHLAGAMGKPVWLLLPFMPDWRWMLDREDSPWYPTLRIFRQKSAGQWDEVIERVAECLARTSNARSR